MCILLCVSMWGSCQAKYDYIYTYAGNGTQGHSGDGGLATSATLYNPFNIAFDSSGK